MLTTMSTRGTDRRRGQGAELSGSVNDLEHLAAGLFAIAERTTERLTIRQMLAFSIVAYTHARGGDITMSEIRAMTDGTVGQALERTFGVFLEPTRHYPDALGWVYQDPDPADRRKKYLRLTAEGERAAASIIADFRAGVLDD